MSLTAQAIVAVTHYLLDGATWADDRVLEQPVEPISDLLRSADETQKPVLAVYVESSKVKIQGRETQGEKGVIDLKIFAYIAPGKTELPEGTQFSLDGRVAGLALNLLGRQVDTVFHSGSSIWLPVWKKFITSISEREVRYMLVEVENAVKIPTMEITYHCETIPDPDFGVPLYGAWGVLDTALRAAAGERAVLADVFKACIENPMGLPSYQGLQTNFAMTAAGLASTGLGPIHPDVVDEDGEPPLLVDVRVETDIVMAPSELEP